MSRLAFQLSAQLERFKLEIELDSEVSSLGLFGASGAGKTTVLEALAGWPSNVCGRIEFGGETWLDSERDIRMRPDVRRVGYVPQDLLLFPHLEVAGNVRFGMPPQAEAVFARAVEVLGLGSLLQRDVAALSGGERQRVALARAIVSRPRLLLLDEPLGALDRPLRRRILPYLLRVREEFDVPLVLVSHDPTEIAALCDDVLVVHEGRVLARGKPAEVLPEASGGARGSEAFENVLMGSVVNVSGDVATVELSRAEVGAAEEPPARLDVPSTGLHLGGRVLVTLRAEDILVAVERPRGLSARNRLAARVERVERGAAARLTARLDSQPVTVELTDAAIDELGLREGSKVFLVFKTRACRAVAT